MSFAYLALFTGDYLRDTRHLTPEEHGIYLLLLMYCWDQKGPVPLDERKQAGIVNARSGGELESLRRVLREFFTCMEDGWYNARMTKEVAKCQQLSKTWSEAGKKGAQAKYTRVGKAKAKPRPRVGQAEATTPSSSSSSSSSSSLSSTPESEALASDPALQGRSAAGVAVISIPLNDKTDYQITQGMISEWEGLYPQVDVLQTLREIRGWNLANPGKRKTKSGVLNHINRWLAKEHNHG